MSVNKVYIDYRVTDSNNSPSSIFQKQTQSLELVAKVREILAGDASDFNGQIIYLDADADTYFELATDDTINVYVNGALDFVITANTLTAASGSVIATNTISETTATSGVTVDGLVIKDNRIEYNATGYFGVTKTADATLTVDETGFIFGNKATALVLTLPATVVGYSYFVVNINGGGTIALSPNASDYVGGGGLTKTDNKDLIIPAVKGAYAHIIADGANGWYIAQASGTLTKEA